MLATVPVALRAGATQVAAMLRDADRDLSLRVEPDAWSPLEYGCHLRDVLLVQRERLLLALRTDAPTVTPMGRDERGEPDGYVEQEPEDVARQLQDAAAMLARCVARLSPEQADRIVVYNYPEPAERSLRWLAVHSLHEVRHHGDDVRRQCGDRPPTRPQRGHD